MRQAEQVLPEPSPDTQDRAKTRAPEKESERACGVGWPRIGATASIPPGDGRNPNSWLTQQRMLFLQRHLGNRYVARLVAQAEEGRGRPTVSPEVEKAIDRTRGSGTPLPTGERERMETAFGADFGQVRIHSDETADGLNRSLGAEAFTTGQDIYFSRGAYQPGSAAGRTLLAHELTHTLQQGSGGSGPRAGDAVSEPQDEAEQEAEAIARNSDSGADAPPEMYGHPGLTLARKAAPHVAQSEPVPVLGTPPAAPASASIGAISDTPNGAGGAAVTPADVVMGSVSAVPVAAPTAGPGEVGGGVAPVALPAAGSGEAGGGAALATPPAAAGAGGLGSATKAPAATQLDASNSESILEALASSPASSFADSLWAAKSSVSAVQSREQEQLERSYPEIERPTGMPASPSPRKAPPLLEKGAQPAVKEPADSSSGTPAPAKTEVASGPVPGANAPVGGGEPPSSPDGNDSGSWWDWLTNHLQSLLASLPTTDPGVSTSAGSRPKVDTSGAADPTQNEAIAASGKAQVDSERTQADDATTAKFGEDEIAPSVNGGKMRPRASKGGAQGGSRNGGKNAPALPNDMRAQLDATRGPSLAAGVGQQIAKHRQDQAQFEKESQKARQDGERRIAAENERARAEQLGLKQTARADVDAERERWRAENQKAVQTYSDTTQTKHAEIEKQIDEKLKATDKSVDEKLTQAETNAAQEKAKAEQEAAQKKADAENKPRSFWDRVKGAVSSFFSDLKNAITGIFQTLRAAVKKLIDEAKALVHDLIDAARRFVIGLIKAFAEVVKVAISVALAAFPGLAKKARDWIDKRVDDAVAAVNKVADALEKTVDAILDTVGEALDAALRALQAAFLAVLDALQALADALLTVMEWLEKLAELLKKFGAFLKGLEELIATGAEKLVNEAKKTLQKYIDQIPAKVESLVQEHAKDLGKAAEKHIAGIWRHLKPALVYLKDHWWDEVKQMVWNLVWPFNEKSPIWKDVPAMVKLPGKIVDSLLQGKVSEGIDEYLEFAQKLNSVVGIFYGWFFIASVLVGAIIGAFFGGAGAIPGAAAGAAFAGEVGEGLLVAMVATETAVIGKAAYDLAFGPGTSAVNESAYDRIANSSLTLAITAAMVILGELAADLAKAIIDGVKGLFKGEAPEVAPGEVPKGEVKPEEPKAGEPPAADIAAKEPTADGHEVEVTKDGRCLICSTCEEVGIKYKNELDANPDLAKELDEARAIEDADAKAKAVADLEAKLAKAREEAWKAETPEQKAEALSKMRTEAKARIEEIREALKNPDNKAAWEGDPKTKAEIEGKLRDLDREYNNAVEGAKDIGEDSQLQDLAREEFDDLRTKAELVKQEVDDIISPPEDAPIPRPNLPYPRNMLPTGGEIPYVSPDPAQEVVQHPHGNGYLDMDGNRWEVDRTKARQGKFFEWDVQHPDGTHTNVGSDGTITH